MPSSPALAQFTRQSYLNLESFRKTGEGVKTPVWFIEHEGSFYVTTEEQSFKVKRIRRNSQVRVVPSDMRGTPKGEWVNATAEIITDATEIERLNMLFNRKYGLVKTLFEKIQARNSTRVMLKITLVA